MPITLTEEDLKQLPVQDAQMHELLYARFDRAASAQRDWAERAKLCVDFFEGKQWSDADLKVLEEEGRPALTLNHVKPLVNVVLGYHKTNRVDATYIPGNDGSSSAEIAEVLTAISKVDMERCGLPYVDSEVFLDGLLGGRGFYDCRLDFEENDFGDIKWSAVDPFSVYIDPEASSYDPAQWGFVFTNRWTSPDEVEAMFGKVAAQYATSFIAGNGAAGLPTAMMEMLDQITPKRTFGETDSDGTSAYAMAHEHLYDFVDPMRKNIRIVECQHYQWTVARAFVDLETGHKVIIPETWDNRRIEAVLAWNQQRGKDIVVQTRRVRRLRWTTMIGDLAVYDRWSPYKTPTIIPFFPYFRRGITRGIVDDMLDPQQLINKMASSELNIMGRTANSGWMVPKDSMSQPDREELERMGGAPGIVVQYDPKAPGGAVPKQIDPPTPPLHMKDFGQRAIAEIKEIGGINDSALGNLDRVQSGRAIEARQRQSIVGIEPVMDNYRRTKEICGGKQLNMMQSFYTERRMFRTIGEGSRLNAVLINDRDPATQVVANDISIGRYSVQVDETPMSASFLSACFDELLLLREKGVPIPDDMLVDASSFGRKDELKQRLQQLADNGVILPPGTPPPLLPSPQAQQQLAAQAQAQQGQQGGGAPGPMEAQREASQQESVSHPAPQGM